MGKSSMGGSDFTRTEKHSAWPKFFARFGRWVHPVGAANEWKVADLSKLLLGQRFASGAHSKVYRGFYLKEPVAVKIIQVPYDNKDGKLEALLGSLFEREVTLLSRLHHPNVVKFVAACKSSSCYCIMTRYLPAGSLRSYLHNLGPNPLPLETLIAMALDIARGMEYVHSQGVIHRDLKPENILIDEEFRLKVADFGTSREEANCRSEADECPGTYRWMAPEMIRKKTYGRKVDVFSFGLILWEMSTGTVPYEGMNPIQAAFAAVNGNARLIIPEDCPLPLRTLIEQCWSMKPEKRPEFAQIVKVLEQFQSLIAEHGTLNLRINPT